LHDRIIQTGRGINSPTSSIIDKLSNHETIPDYLKEQNQKRLTAENTELKEKRSKIKDQRSKIIHHEAIEEHEA